MQVVIHHPQILTDGIQQFRFSQTIGHRDQHPVDLRRIPGRALLRILTVRIQIDLFRQPLLRPRHITAVGPLQMQGRQCRTHDPSVVRRMQPTDDQRLPGPLQELLDTP